MSKENAVINQKGLSNFKFAWIVGGEATITIEYISRQYALHAKVHLRSPEPSFYCYNFAPTGPIGKIQAPICSSSNAAAIGVQKSLLQILYLVAVLEMAYF